MARDPREESIQKHKEWLGFLQPVGLVVSPPALVDADCHVNVDIAADLQRFVASTTTQLVVGHTEPLIVVKDLKATLKDVFGWQDGDIVTAEDPRAADLVVPLTEYGESLRPTIAVPEDAKAQPAKWLMLIQELPLGTPFDTVTEADTRKWKATAEARFERLLRETQVPVGLLSNGIELRLVYAPRGESPGHITFPVAVMTETSGRPVFAALHMLLREFRVFGAPDGQRLPDILAASRKYQSTVSTELSKQVLAALYELLRGFQAADAQRNGQLLKDVLTKNPDQVYAGQLTVLLRLVFLLYAEDRGLMSDSELYVKNYSVTGLFEKLRADDGRHPDTMDQRYGAWARLVTLFRMIHDGAKAGSFVLPARHGYLFDPDRYPFLEGRPLGSKRVAGERIVPPLVSDGVIYRVLRNLVILDGERLSYRALDVEQIGSVYEAMMGFRVELATGPSIAIKPKKSHGAPVTVDLERLLNESPDKRAKWFKDFTDREPTAKEAAALKASKTAEDAVAALDRKVEKDVTPNIVSAGSMVLQPSDERRRSGSHYTPRSLTEPIVRKALEPILKRMGDSPRPEQILDLKVCDPAMGSGAFLVETARQLGELLMKAWHRHGCLPNIPPDEDELLHAQRLVAQRCLYGVDKNPLAVDLAKLSLWLTTLAKEHPFTFVDHALRFGDSLVGLTREQIVEFHWKDCPQRVIGQDIIEDRIKAASESRRAILEADEFMDHSLKEQKLQSADEALQLVRFTGNLAVAAFFDGETTKQRQVTRDEYLRKLSEYLKTGNPLMRPTVEERRLRTGESAVEPFHWEIEFPEVFGREQSGFDVIIGNPPFLGGTKASKALGKTYVAWLLETNSQSHGKSDLVAYFFRQAFRLLRNFGTFGLIATNSIRESITRETGLTFIVQNGGVVFSATRRLRWPGDAAVVVSVVYVHKGEGVAGPFDLDNRLVERISSFLFHTGPDSSPAPLAENSAMIFSGINPNGEGFVLSEEQKNSFIIENPANENHIKPYLGYEEMSDSPDAQPVRYIINFEGCDISEVERFPGLHQHLSKTVKLQRQHSSETRLREKWWLYSRGAKEYYDLVSRSSSKSVLVCGRGGVHISFVFQSIDTVFSDSLCLVPTQSYGFFAVLQGRLHEIWARFFSSSFKDDPRYIPEDCFENCPFPRSLEAIDELESTGRLYYEFRRALMAQKQEGLTKIYNRFHDRFETCDGIQRLRELHDEMDRAVLQAYGPPFSKLAIPPCEFILDYEDDDDEEEQTGKRQKKKPWRYRWPDEFRDEVLALLLELNSQRAEEEKKALAAKPAPAKGSPRKKKAQADSAQPNLFDG